MVDTKHKFTFFAAPTGQDTATWDALSEEEKRAIFLAEIDKGLSASIEPVTKNTQDEIKASVIERYARKK